MRGPLPLILVLSAALGCHTTKTTSPAVVESEMRRAAPARAWELHSTEGATVGLVLFFRAQDQVGDSLYMVRNLWHQDLGLIDAYGRAYRYLPHHRLPAWVGSGTVLQGAERILGVQECGLVEVPFPEASRRPATPGEHDQRRIEIRTEVPGMGAPPAPAEPDSRSEPQ